MANFIFNWAGAALTAATLDLNTGNYYAHLVTTVPSTGHSTVANLTLPAVSGYAATPLTGLSNNTTRWTFDSFSFPRYAFVTAPTGVVICKRNGAIPANSDQIICYSDFNNSIGQTILLTTGAYVVNLQFSAAGAINYSYRYQYSVNPYANTEAVPKGIIFLIGSKNNTLAYTNPFTASTSLNPAMTDRTIGTVPLFQNRQALDLGVCAAKIGSFGFEHRDVVAKTARLSGSNALADNAFTIDAANDALWTTLGTVTNLISGWNFITVTDQNYWRYFRLDLTDGTTTLSIREMEFYNSTVLSPTANFA